MHEFDSRVFRNEKLYETYWLFDLGKYWNWFEQASEPCSVPLSSSVEWSDVTWQPTPLGFGGQVYTD